MAGIKSVQFKDPSVKLHVSGIGVIDANNITLDIYKRLVTISPAHEKYFDVVLDKSKPKATNSVESEAKENLETKTTISDELQA